MRRAGSPSQSFSIVSYVKNMPSPNPPGGSSTRSLSPTGSVRRRVNLVCSSSIHLSSSFRRTSCHALFRKGLLHVVCSGVFLSSCTRACSRVSGSYLSKQPLNGTRTSQSNMVSSGPAFSMAFSSLTMHWWAASCSCTFAAYKSTFLSAALSSVSGIPKISRASPILAWGRGRGCAQLCAFLTFLITKLSRISREIYRDVNLRYISREGARF